jgi:hypothetical protein
MTISVQRSTGQQVVNFQANTPYVISNANFKNLYQDVKKNIFKVTVYDWRMPNFNIAAVRKGEPILYFNGSGGFGDQITSWPVANILHRLGFEVHVMAELGLESCWWHFPWVKSIVPSPISQGQLEMWKNMAFMEAVVNFDEHPDQLHPVDVQLKKFGIDPTTIDPALKCVTPVFTPGELQQAERVRGGVSKLGIYQLASTSPIRSLGIDQSISTLSALATRFPDVAWIAIYDTFVSTELVEKAKALGHRNVRILSFESLRVLWATIAVADVCVGPDSLVVHVAGTMGTPMVGMWGSLPPSSRVKYYKNHVPIWHQNACQFSPCFISTHAFPPYCPPTQEARTTCAVIGAISLDEVGDAVEKIIS